MVDTGEKSPWEWIGLQNVPCRIEVDVVNGLVLVGYQGICPVSVSAADARMAQEGIFTVSLIGGLVLPPVIEDVDESRC